ncbi:unnamed protein product [Vitrella brassicaformis CCMP3155]|uniref:RING-type E3 ubiquitin transferase n=3 Tax=Vitrella brassicaformis TaxID=1169539 RepID=A0A0G4EV24_VITBC|nr:unnamed protein product [Vitrella brassicaformis CCMP3155]|eukprot:CEM01892.1 unnamed protein product [Vitrella brassicaformis CCMP3155]
MGNQQSDGHAHPVTHSCVQGLQLNETPPLVPPARSADDPRLARETVQLARPEGEAASAADGGHPREHKDQQGEGEGKGGDGAHSEPPDDGSPSDSAAVAVAAAEGGGTINEVREVQRKRYEQFKRSQRGSAAASGSASASSTGDPPPCYPTTYPPPLNSLPPKPVPAVLRQPEANLRELDTLWIRPYKTSEIDALFEDNQHDQERVQQYLWDTYVKSFFSEQLRYVESGQNLEMCPAGVEEFPCTFRITCCSPWDGVVTASTVFHLIGEPLIHQPAERLHLLPIGSPPALAGVPDDQAGAALFARYIKPFFRANTCRHLIEGETLVCDDVRFKVVALTPPQGFITRETRIHMDGTPLSYYELVEFQPIDESLPPAMRGERYNGDAQDQLFELYLRPHYEGRECIVRNGEEIVIDKVRFKPITFLPRLNGIGVVGANTAITCAQHTMSEEALRQLQINEDMRLAMQLQQREGGLRGLRMMGRGRGGPHPPAEFPGLVRLGFPGSSSGISDIGAWLRGTIQQMYETLPRDDPRRARLALILEEFPDDTNFDIDTLQRFRERLEFRGASEQDIQRRTITWNFAKPAHPPPSEDIESDDRLTCRICLAPFENDELIRCLPCFHRFHSTCATSWLRQSKVCPICKMAIDASGTDTNPFGETPDLLGAPAPTADQQQQPAAPSAEEGDEEEADASSDDQADSPPSSAPHLPSSSSASPPPPVPPPPPPPPGLPPTLPDQQPSAGGGRQARVLPDEEVAAFFGEEPPGMPERRRPARGNEFL